MRLEGDTWPSYLALKDGPPNVAARSSFGDVGSGTGPAGGQICKPEVYALCLSLTYLMLVEEL